MTEEMLIKIQAINACIEADLKLLETESYVGDDRFRTWNIKEDIDRLRRERNRLLNS